MLAIFQEDYNTVRPHSGLGNLPPVAPNSTLLGCNGPGRLSYLGAPSPVPLHHRATRAQMKLGLYSSLDERRGSGQQQARFPRWLLMHVATSRISIGRMVSPGG